MRVLYGLDRLPRSVDTSRLPAVTLGAAPLRLNSVPVPPVVLAGAGAGHAGRMRAARAWLHAACGDYAGARRRWIDSYLDWAEAAVSDAPALDRYGGVYEPEDWLWSALRPLPRAWLPGAGHSVDFAFWNGQILTAVCLGTATDLPETADVQRVGPTWRPDAAYCLGEILPRSPFRRSDLLER